MGSEMCIRDRFKSLLEQYDMLMEEKEVKKQELNVIDQSLDRIKACFINSLKGADDTRYDRGIIVHNDEKITLNYEQKEPKVTFNVESSQRLAEMYPDIYQKFCTVQKQSPRFSLKKENLKKGESTQKANIQKQRLKVQKLHHKIDNIRTDHINKTIAEIVKTKPSYITIEDLNVKGMMKNRHLSKAVASQKFYEFRIKLQAKCNENGMELRVANRWYPSSKTCHCCKNIRKDLKLSDRIFKCACGYIEDRDFNAALNLRDAMTYEVA
mgnify:FL=1